MRVRIESSFHPGRNQYHLDGASREIRLPRRRWYDSHADMLDAIEKLNPGIEII